MREHLDEGTDVDFAELPILAVGAIMKEFLRALPDSVMTLSLYDGKLLALLAPSTAGSCQVLMFSLGYTEMVATNKVLDETARLQDVAAVLAKLPSSNRYLLGALMPLFVEICKAEEINSMNGR